VQLNLLFILCATKSGLIVIIIIIIIIIIIVEWTVEVCRLPGEEEDSVAYNLRGSCGSASSK